MIWKPATAILRRETGKDSLGNPLYEESPGASFPARFTPWDNQEIALEGREITRNSRKLLVRVARKEFPACEKVSFDGGMYTISQITDLYPRFTLLYVTEHKG